MCTFRSRCRGHWRSHCPARWWWGGATQMLDVPQRIDDNCFHRVFQPAAHGLTGISLCLLHHEKSYICLLWKGFVGQAPLQLNANVFNGCINLGQHLHNLRTTFARHSHANPSHDLHTTFARPSHNIRSAFTILTLLRHAQWFYRTGVCVRQLCEK